MQENKQREADSLVLCCDWGTTNFRLRLTDRKRLKIISEVHSDDGILSVFQRWQKQSGRTNRADFYGKFLRGKIGEIQKVCSLNLQSVPVLVSGMASSSIGIRELPYATLPFPLEGREAISFLCKPTTLKNPVFIMSGVKSDTDVMRGEETQLIGLVGLNKNLRAGDGEVLVILPGTHSKHITVRRGKMTGFRTFMTGEIFDALCNHTILSNSVSTDSEAGGPTSRNLAAFKKGVDFFLHQKSPLLHALFLVRTNRLFRKLSMRENYFFLSGLLIGSEIEYLSTGSSKTIVVCCSDTLRKLYKAAFGELALTKSQVLYMPSKSLEEATIWGQIRVYQSSKFFR